MNFASASNTNLDDFSLELSPPGERLNPGSRGYLSPGHACEADPNLPSPDLGLMVEGRAARKSKLRRG